MVDVIWVVCGADGAVIVVSDLVYINLDSVLPDMFLCAVPCAVFGV